MQCAVKLFVIPVDRVPMGPPEPPRVLDLEAATQDGLREAAVARVIAEGYRLRSISFGPDGLVVYAEEQP